MVNDVDQVIKVVIVTSLIAQTNDYWERCRCEDVARARRRVLPTKFDGLGGSIRAIKALSHSRDNIRHVFDGDRRGLSRFKDGLEPCTPPQ
jgi:hypothetical protein